MARKASTKRKQGPPAKAGLEALIGQYPASISRYRILGRTTAEWIEAYRQWTAQG